MLFKAKKIFILVRLFTDCLVDAGIQGNKMNNYKSFGFLAIISLVLLATPTEVFGWGKNGHRIVGKLAENHMTANTLAEVKALLDGDRISEVGTWADEMRSNPSDFWQKVTPKWHYLNINEISDFHPEHYSSEDEVKDAYTGIRKAMDVLADKNASKQDKQLYLRFLIHLVGDVHQPLHLGRAEDHGGNKIKVKFFWQDTNLHSLWDTQLIEQEKLSFSEFASYIDTQDSKLISQYLNSRPADWIEESFHQAQDIYQVGDKDFSYNYVYKYMPVVKERLLQGGIRLAGLLNEIYDPESVPGKTALKQK